MAAQPHSELPRPAPRLYLVTPPVEDAAAFARLLEPLRGIADLAAVLLKLAPAGESELIRRVKALAPGIQGIGAALILDGHPDIVARAGADGAHLTGIGVFTDAVESLKPDRIAGAGGMHTRHDAMLAAEADADYVMFGEPEVSGQRPAFGAIEDRVAWWAEVFQLPCVAFAAALEEIEPLAAAGADFVAVGDCIWNDARGPAAALADATARLVLREKVE
jgi:thiamine-phosphate pyrophosphorylase